MKKVDHPWSSSKLNSCEFKRQEQLTRSDIEDAAPDPPEGVWNSLGDHSGEGALLERRDVVLGRPADRGQIAEAVGKTSDGQLHLVESR